MNAIDPHDRRSDVGRPLPLTRRMLLGGAAAGVASIWAPRGVRAQTRIDVTQGTVKPMPIALPDFVGVTPNDGEVARNVTQIITANLKRSGLFAPIDQAAYIERITNIDTRPRFPEWRTIAAQALVTGRCAQTDGRLKTEFRLWDVASSEQLIVGLQYRHGAEKLAAHRAHDLGRGLSAAHRRRRLFRFAGWCSSTSSARRTSGSSAWRSWIRTARTCASHRGDDLVLTPRFSPGSTQEITYMSFGGREPRVFLLNIETLQREVVGNLPEHDASRRASRPTASASS